MAINKQVIGNIYLERLEIVTPKAPNKLVIVLT